MPHSESYKRILNRMGYYNYQQGLIYRYMDQEEGWNSHLKKCRDFILQAMDDYKPPEVTVLGSGWLLDLPLAEILEKTQSVRLIDIVHPPETIRQVSELENVEILEMDITGGLIAEVWEKTRKIFWFNKLKTLELIEIPDFKLPGDPGLIISLNILTQLEELIIEHLRKKSSVNKEEFDRFRSKVQMKHINFLASNNLSVLITDTHEIFTDKSGKTTNRQSVVIDLPKGRKRDTWTWKFDLERSDYFQKRSVMEVVAIML
jgi:hypothetical protein